MYSYVIRGLVLSTSCLIGSSSASCVAILCIWVKEFVDDVVVWKFCVFSLFVGRFDHFYF